MTEDEYFRIQAELHNLAFSAAQEWGMGGAPQCPHGNIWEDCKEVCACGHPCNQHVDVHGQTPEEVALEGIGGHEHRAQICTEKGCTCGLASTSEQEPHRVQGTSPYFVEYRAHGRFQARVGRELSDGRTVWLSGPPMDGNSTATSYARGLRNLRRLMWAVRAARMWKDEAAYWKRQATWPGVTAALGVGAIASVFLGASGFLGGKKS
jgi:hypothetical protein